MNGLMVARGRVWNSFAPYFFTEERVEGTAAEVNKIVALLGIAPGAKVLDLCCGTLTRFFLSDYPDWGRTVTRRTVEEYVRSHFTNPRGYRLSCDQDALSLLRR
jgi:hypothetical protein